MILKKPYAFFIKFFKLFHLIIFGLSSVLLYRTSLVYNFMKEFCKDSPNVIGKDLVGPLFVWWVYLLIGIIILVNLLIIYIMARKVKPYMYYVINIFLYMAVMIVFITSHRVIGNMQSMLVAAKTTLAIRDILNLARLFQTISVVFYLIRATGFDIKKFDFVHDLQGLDISPEDSEEIEVAIEFEGNVFIRNFKRIYREFKYYYRENKFIINIFSLAAIGALFLFIYLSTSKYDKVYKENQFVSISGYRVGVKSSYIINTDYFGKKIISDDVLVGVKVSISGSGTYQSSKNVLVVNGMQYYPISGYSSSVSDLGNLYSNQNIVSDFTDYLFLYKIPKDYINSDMILRFVDNITVKRGKTIVNSLDVRLSPINYINVVADSNFYSLGEDINIGDYKININSYDINKQFVVNYNSCVVNGECYDFREILRPVVSRDREKVLLKVNGNITNGEKNIDLSRFISEFGSVEYSYDGKTYIESRDFNSVVSTKTDDNSTYYIEIDKEINDSSEIKLCFNFRDVKYCYILRGDKSE